LRDLRDKYGKKDNTKDAQLSTLKNWYQNALNNKNFELKEMEDKHKSAINKIGDDHDRKVNELNNAHGQTS